MKLGDLQINFKAAKEFIRRWSTFELNLADFTKMLEESTTWHNIDIDVLKTVAYFESGYPQATVTLARGRKPENPYRSNFRRPGSVFVGPFQEGDVYLAGVRENKSSKFYNWLTLAAKTESLSLGVQLYLMVAEKVRLSEMQWRGVGSIGHTPLNAGVIYSLHVRPLAVFKFYATRDNFNVLLPRSVYSGQSDAVTTYFARTNINALDTIDKATSAQLF